jgi:hypothetical protein
MILSEILVDVALPHSWQSGIPSQEDDNAKKALIPLLSKLIWERRHRPEVAWAYLTEADQEIWDLQRLQARRMAATVKTGLYIGHTIGSIIPDVARSSSTFATHRKILSRGYSENITETGGWLMQNMVELCIVNNQIIEAKSSEVPREATDRETELDTFYRWEAKRYDSGLHSIVGHAIDKGILPENHSAMINYLADWKI